MIEFFLTSYLEGFELRFQTQSLQSQSFQFTNANALMITAPNLRNQNLYQTII